MNDEKKLALRNVDADMIDKGLEVCTNGDACRSCPYWIYGGDCVNILMKDARAHIYQLKNGGELPDAVEG